MLGAVAGLRLEIACGPRGEVHEVDAREVAVGGAAVDDLVVDHPSVEPAHARIALRRDRVLVVPNPRAHRSVRVGTRVVGAPVVVPVGAPVHLGEVTVWPSPASPHRPWVPTGVVLGTERAAPDHLRRFQAQADGRPAELAWTVAPPAEVVPWLERVEASRTVASLPPLVECGQRPLVLQATAPGSEVGGWLVERVPRGVRLSVVLDALARGALTVPAEARVIIISQLAAGLTALHAAWGPHGAIDGRTVHLGADGRVVLMRPGPILSSWSDRVRRRFLAPERRHGGRPTVAADAWSVARLARDLGAPPDPWARLSEPDPARRPTELVALAEQARLAAVESGLDPSTRHLAQLVDLVTPPERPLVRVVARDLSAPPG